MIACVFVIYYIAGADGRQGTLWALITFGLCSLGLFLWGKSFPGFLAALFAMFILNLRKNYRAQ